MPGLSFQVQAVNESRLRQRQRPQTACKHVCSTILEQESSSSLLLKLDKSNPKIMETLKKKRISKKRKSAWRKTDIRDVEEFLELQREDERIGSIADKSNEELFQVDTEFKPTKRPVLSEKQRRKLNALKPPRFCKGLENISKVPDPIAKRNIVKRKPLGRDLLQEVLNPCKPRHFTANHDRYLHYAKHEARIKKRSEGTKDTGNHDIWAEEDFRNKVPGLKCEGDWIPDETSLHVMKNLGLPLVKVHDGIRHKTTKLKKFEAPHPGTSYNPSRKDYDNLMATVVDKETNIIKEEKHLKRVTTRMFTKVTPEQREIARLKELAEGLDEESGDDDQAEQEVEITGEEAASSSYETINPPVQNEKKTRTTRNKEQRQKELERRTQKKELLKKQIVDINRIKSLKAEVLAEDEQLAELKKRRRKTAERKKYEPKRLSRHKFAEAEIDISMPDDISGNVRNIKPESTLLLTQFKRFQKRNILPMSVKASARKAVKVKRFVRSSHKEPGITHEMLRKRRLALNSNSK